MSYYPKYYQNSLNRNYQENENGFQAKQLTKKEQKKLEKEMKKEKKILEKEAKFIVSQKKMQSEFYYNSGYALNGHNTFTPAYPY
jgi:hypothetical protein